MPSNGQKSNKENGRHPEEARHTLPNCVDIHTQEECKVICTSLYQLSDPVEMVQGDGMGQRNQRNKNKENRNEGIHVTRIDQPDDPYDPYDWDDSK